MLNYVVVNLGLLFKKNCMAHKPHIPNATYQNDLMLQSKHNLPFGLREENLKGFYNIWPWRSFLVKLPDTKCEILFYLTYTPYEI